MNFVFRKDSGKSPKKSLKVAFLRVQNENLVAPLSIVLTQACMNYEH